MGRGDAMAVRIGCGWNKGLSTREDRGLGEEHFGRGDAARVEQVDVGGAAG